MSIELQNIINDLKTSSKPETKSVFVSTDLCDIHLVGCLIVVTKLYSIIIYNHKLFLF